MKIEQKKWTLKDGWKTITVSSLPAAPQLILAFGSRSILKDHKVFDEINSMYPNSNILTCSTSGEILGTEVSDGSISLTAIYFEKTNVHVSEANIVESSESYNAGKKLAEGLSKEGLAHAMVFSDGLKVNGTALIHGITEVLGREISVTGGLAGDGDSFVETIVGINAAPTTGKLVLIGFYGTSLKIGMGSFGGWSPFGPERLITKSKENILYELDGKPALELYKRYLGDKANDLPGAGLFFPLSLKIIDSDEKISEVARACLSVSEAEQSMTFAGDMPEGLYVRLMKVDYEDLIQGAEAAAEAAKTSSGIPSDEQPDLAILVSCVSRKLVLKERTEEEIEAVHDILGVNSLTAGFYSYGEVSPTTSIQNQSQLHNQTMTITTFKEN